MTKVFEGQPPGLVKAVTDEFEAGEVGVQQVVQMEVIQRQARTGYGGPDYDARMNGELHVVAAARIPAVTVACKRVRF